MYSLSTTVDPGYIDLVVRARALHAWSCWASPPLACSAMRGGESGRVETAPPYLVRKIGSRFPIRRLTPPAHHRLPPSALRLPPYFPPSLAGARLNLAVTEMCMTAGPGLPLITSID